MKDVSQLMEELKKDLRIFYKNKNIKKRLEIIMSLFDPDREGQKVSDDLVCLIDSLNDIGEAIEIDLPEKEYNYSEIKKAVTPFEKFFRKKPKDEISEEEIEKIKQEIREARN